MSRHAPKWRQLRKRLQRHQHWAKRRRRRRSARRIKHVAKRGERCARKRRCRHALLRLLRRSCHCRHCDGVDGAVKDTIFKTKVYNILLCHLAAISLCEWLHLREIGCDALIQSMTFAFESFFFALNSTTLHYQLPSFVVQSNPA